MAVADDEGGTADIVCYGPRGLNTAQWVAESGCQILAKFMPPFGKRTQLSYGQCRRHDQGTEFGDIKKVLRNRRVCSTKTALAMRAVFVLAK